ncbi:hypothetical protein ACSAM1_06575 [Xanthomonas citri pv. bilvae]|uniref:hypothetical protein n=2 Tax=Xanthomonas citri TaxID=346 RepID=UPI0005432734|nr:conserved exported hypothetical protein [Xanthomonas citri pv. bilvae]
MLKMLAACAVALALCGCVSQKLVKADLADLEHRKASKITVTRHEMPAFVATTATKVTFGLIGALAAVSAGNAIVRDNQVEDPADHIASHLAQTLSTQLAIPVEQGRVIKPTSSAAEMSKMFPDGGLVLDVQTTNWSSIYFPTDWNNYRVIYVAKLQLIDTAKKSKVAEGLCVRVPEYTADAPSYKQLLANQAADLKMRLRRSADGCIQEFSDKVLGVRTGTLTEKAQLPIPGSVARTADAAPVPGAATAYALADESAVSIKPAETAVAPPSSSQALVSSPASGSQWIDGWNKRRSGKTGTPSGKAEQ